MRKASSDVRTPEQIREHYEIEFGLSDQLRSSAPEARRQLYASVYDDLFTKVTHHPQLHRRDSPEGRTEKATEVAAQLRFLRRFVTAESTYMEIGAGDCALAYAMASEVAQVIAVDVSTEITKGSATPPNFKLAISDGVMSRSN